MVVKTENSRKKMITPHWEAGPYNKSHWLVCDGIDLYFISLSEEAGFSKTFYGKENCHWVGKSTAQWDKMQKNEFLPNNSTGIDKPIKPFYASFPMIKYSGQKEASLDDAKRAIMSDFARKQKKFIGTASAVI